MAGGHHPAFHWADEAERGGLQCSASCITSLERLRLPDWSRKRIMSNSFADRRTVFVPHASSSLVSKGLVR